MLQTSLLRGEQPPPTSSLTPRSAGIQSLRSSIGSCTADLLGHYKCGGPSVGLDTTKTGHQTAGGGGCVAASTPRFENILTSVEFALNAPALHQRCAELSGLLADCPAKDLPAVFHTIVDRVFGVTSGGGRGWVLTAVQRSAQYKDFVAVADFLSPRGPVLRAAGRLLADPYLRYEFPFSLLSQPTRQQMEAGCVSPFLAAKLSSAHHGAAALVLQLNSFEFYMFSFAAYIVQPYMVDNKFIPGESLYPQVLEDYLAFFLPCDGTTPPRLPFPLAVATTSAPVGAAAAEAARRPVAAVTPTRKSLLKQSAMSPAAPPMRSTPPTTTTTVVSSPSGQEVWRSETLINTLAEFWLTPFSPPPPLARGRHGSPSLDAATADLNFAVSDTLRIVRMMIKHLHYFTNSGGPNDVTPLDQLKRCVLPSMRQQIYGMFKYTFTHWPHDLSFRLVLETWLSYIQPWRYTDSGMRARGGEEANSVSVDSAWQQFVAENILFYTTIVKLLLPRFFRMDLTSSKNAYMLFRLAKIYSQVGLPALLKHAEAGLDRSINTSGGGVYMPGILDYIEVSDAVTAAARQCANDLEGTVKYEPIFGNTFRQSVSDLLSLATRARDAAQDSIAEHDKVKKAESSGLAWVLEQLTGTGSRVQDTAEVEDYRKSVMYLNQSIAGLSQVFDLKTPDADLTNGRTRLLSGVAVAPGRPESCDVDGQQVLTPLGRWQVLQGLAKPDVRYEGDPDLKPITHSELVWLVRMLYDLSQWFNTRYSRQMSELYEQEGVLGESARLLLAPPACFTILERTLDGSPPRRRHGRHGPRLSLRILANKQVLVYLIGLLYILSLVLGSGLVFALFVLLVLGGGLVICVTGCRALKRAAKDNAAAGLSSPHIKMN